MGEQLKLTPLGELAYRRGVFTSPSWWRTIWTEVNKIADQDGEWEIYLDEKIAGLTEMRERFYELNAEG